MPCLHPNLILRSISSYEALLHGKGVEWSWFYCLDCAEDFLTTPESVYSFLRRAPGSRFTLPDYTPLPHPKII